MTAADLIHRPGPSNQSAPIPPSFPQSSEANRYIEGVLKQILENQTDMTARQNDLINRERQRTAREALNIPDNNRNVFPVNRNGGRNYLTPV